MTLHQVVIIYVVGYLSGVATICFVDLIRFFKRN